MPGEVETWKARDRISGRKRPPHEAAWAALGLLRSRRGAEAADAALKAGAAGAVAAAAGLADWQYTNGRERRLGLVHALANGTALALTLASIGLRRRGHRAEGRALSAAGWACMALGGYLGGHLVYRRRVGVDHADHSPKPRDFVPVLPLAELAEDRPRRVEVWDPALRQEVGVVLVRHGGRVYALGARCSHMGGPLDEGWVLEGRLVCPWHGSRYPLGTGCPASGPSTAPQPRYAVGVRDGMVELRRVPEPGEEAVFPEDVAQAAAGKETGGIPLARRAEEVLTELHDLLRGLFARIEALPPGNPERRDLLRTLASELEIHEYVEDHLFYPAVRAVSDDVAIAHSEHRQLSDLLTMTLKLDTASPEFGAHLRALRAAVEHHAGSEERSMFVHAARLGEARLRALGRELEAMLEEQRTSRFRRAFRELKIGLLEGVRRKGW
ncbi:Rieske 2Fe-2S domain-containing protein [Crenalkalicoccus roseus]|uniref:Rieske 2Fe-2S domain-containing protein n=1 Tax=Crenalkalicoccus roseus TaxID=1485588 RepID=UPI00107FE608|nr:Rieske 2Fe-2S domain-containing protein [Crenalkalicoccus roseus]